MLATFARNADLLLMESSFLKGKGVKKHLELAEAVHLIRHAEPRRAMLTHFYSDWDDVDFEKEVSRLSPGCEVMEAIDGLRVEISK